MPIQIGGIVSGLDIESVIQQLLEVDARIKTKLETKKTDTESIKDLFGTFNTRMLALKTESDNLLLSSTFQKRSATSTDANIVSATVTDGAAPGTYNIVVDNLATASTRTSTAKINTNRSRRSTSAVSPGTSPVDLTKSFADNVSAGLLPSTLAAGSTITLDSDGDTNYTSSALSSYASIQAFLDEINAFDFDSGAGAQNHVNAYYDSTTDRFVVERKNSTAGTLTLTESVADGFFTSTNITTGAIGAGVNEAGLNAKALLKNLNTDTAIASGVSSSFTLNGVTITYNTDTDTLQNLIDRINNANASTGVTAFYDQSIDRLTLRRTSEGPQTISIGGTDTAGLLSGASPRFKMTNTTGFTNGEQAKFFINESTDLATTTLITSDSNSYTFNGISITLKRDGNNSGSANITTAPVDPTATITVTQDTASVSTAVKAFVTAYNDLAQFYTDNASYDPATESGGKLFGDSLLSSVDSRIKRILFQQQPALVDTHELLAQIGVRLGAFDTPDANRLVVDETKLTNAIASNANAVEQLFGRSTVNGTIKNAGIAFDLSNYITDVTKFQGLLDIRETTLTDQITDIDERIAAEDDRLERLESSLRRQFSAMETALAKLNAEGSSVVQQLSRL